LILEVRCGAIKLLGYISWKRQDVIQRLKTLLNDLDDPDSVPCFAVVALARVGQMENSYWDILIKAQNHDENWIR
jgi:hypothetical protein